MGEAGKKFVEASEDVRLLSGSYERATVQAMRLLDAMEERIFSSLIPRPPVVRASS